MTIDFGLFRVAGSAQHVARQRWRALSAGATSTGEPVDQPYGDREAAVQDPFGNYWYIATHQGEAPTGHSAAYIPVGLHTINSYLHPRGAPQLIDLCPQLSPRRPFVIRQ